MPLKRPCPGPIGPTPSAGYLPGVRVPALPQVIIMVLLVMFAMPVFDVSGAQQCGRGGSGFRKGWMGCAL